MDVCLGARGRWGSGVVGLGDSVIDGLGGIHKHLLHCDHFYTLLVLLLQYSFASSGGKKKKKRACLFSNPLKLLPEQHPTVLLLFILILV